MKTSNLKTIMTSLLMVSVISFSPVVKADDVALVVVSRPAVLDEGTQRTLSDAQIAELLPWAKNSKSFLVDLLSSVQQMSSAYQVERLVDGIKSAVGESAPKNSELLMRYALNRSLVLYETLNKEMAADEVGSVDVKIRVLKSSIEMALKYYDADMQMMSKKVPTDFASFGTAYFSFLNELNKSIFDASAQYQIQRISLEWLQWDLYRDLNNASYATQIVKINNSLKIFPVAVSSDQLALTYIKQMKLLGSQLGIRIVRQDRPVISSNSGSDREEELSSSGNYKASSNGSCYVYNASTGRLLTSQSVDNDYCSKGNYKASSNGKCYGFDKVSGYLLTSASVDNSNCINDSYKASSNGKCYGFDKVSGYLLTSEAVDNSYCVDNSYRASSDGKCYGYDKVSGYLLTSETVDNKYCSRDKYRASSDGKCYGYDETSGYLLTSRAVKDSFCSQGNYRASSDGNCYGYDKASGYFLTSKPVDVNYCSR